MVQIFLQVLARETVPDNTGLVLILGVFLAGTGSIVGAIIGGIADLKELLKEKPQTSVKPQE
jgi:ABC-type branched-subunit amino acid transport system permease subunit